MFRYALALMIDNKRAQVVANRGADGKVWLMVRTVAGDEFEVLQPATSKELERALRA